MFKSLNQLLQEKQITIRAVFLDLETLETNIEKEKAVNKTSKLLKKSLFP